MCWNHTQDIKGKDHINMVEELYDNTNSDAELDVLQSVPAPGNGISNVDLEASHCGV